MSHVHVIIKYLYSGGRYQIAENIDAQLKRMTEDLKEVIDHLNTTSGAQDSTDPVWNTAFLYILIVA